MEMQREQSSKRKNIFHGFKLTVKDIALIGMMIALLEVCKRAMDFLPNVELVTFWIIMFTLFLGKKGGLWGAGICVNRRFGFRFSRVVDHVSLFMAATGSGHTAFSKK